LISLKNEPITAGSETKLVQPDSAISFKRDISIAAKGGGLSFIGRLFEYAVRFVFSIIVARAIGVEQFGLFTLGLTAASILSNISMLGLQTGMVRFLPPAIREKDDAGIWGIIQVGLGLPGLFSLFLAVGLFLLAGPLANLVFQNPRLLPFFQLASIIIPLDTLGSLAYVVIISYKRPEYSVLVNNIIMPLAKLFLTIGALAAGFSVIGILIAHIITSGIGLVLLLYFVNSLYSLRRPLNSAHYIPDQLMRYSLPVHAGWTINILQGTLETLVLGFVGLTSGVGVYAAASRLNNIGNMFYSSVGNISTPIIADLFVQGERIQLKKYYQTTTRWLISFSLPLFLTFFIFTKQLLTIFGEDFSTGASGLMILSIGMLVFNSTGLGANILDMANHTKVNMINSFVMVLLTIGLDLFLIPRWGVVGAALAASISVVTINIVRLLEVWYLLAMQPYNRSVFKPILAAVIAGVVTVYLNGQLALPSLLQLALGITFLWSIYALVLFCLGFSEEDLMLVRRAWEKLTRSSLSTQPKG